MDCICLAWPPTTSPAARLDPKLSPAAIAPSKTGQHSSADGSGPRSRDQASSTCNLAARNPSFFSAPRTRRARSPLPDSSHTRTRCTNSPDEKPSPANHDTNGRSLLHRQVAGKASHVRARAVDANHGPRANLESAAQHVPSSAPPSPARSRRSLPGRRPHSTASGPLHPSFAKCEASHQRHK